MQEQLTIMLDADYKEMARNESREDEALEWAEATFGDVANEAVEAQKHKT